MMKRSRAPIALVLLFLLIAAGVLLGSNRHRQRQHATGQPGAFDYYVLALSWSPEFCHSHPTKAECASGKFGFVVHGLWPQYAERYPENCSTAPGLSDPSRMADIMSDTGLVAHEWTTHGTCSGLDADSYFKLVRRAFESVKVPGRLATPKQGFSITPQELKKEFVAANPRLNAEGLAVSCGNNYLTGIDVCFDKQLQPRACEGLRDCRANRIKVAPVRGAE
ncbi:MAG: ribonuclease T(2) [Acidobacteriia bacterium]|nr:ribonuclease T(2) [Terriglobia bacterium]